ncbi:MAG: hypothetical protein ACTSU2_01085 [Promethearchaeota archaeon]
MWKKKHELELEELSEEDADYTIPDEERKDKTPNEEIKTEGGLALSKLDEDDSDLDENLSFSRRRNISRAEKLFKKMEKGAISLTKFRLKLKRLSSKKDIREEILESLKETEMSDDRERFRRLISFTFSERYLEEFISTFQALGFVELGGFEYLGRRDADYSMAWNIDNMNRLHARVYVITNNVFVLVHYEPQASEDLSLHIKGYFNRILKQILEEQKSIKADDVLNSNIEELPTKNEGALDSVKQESPTGSGVELNEQVKKRAGRLERLKRKRKKKEEYSNYELGRDLILKILKEKVPNFYRKINTNIGDEELKLWTKFLGEIDHLSPEELIIENLYENSRMVPPFERIRDTLKKVFKRFNFEVKPAWTLEVPASEKYLEVTFRYLDKRVHGLIIAEDLKKDVLKVLGLLKTKYRPKFILYIVPDISLFGPEPDDIPPEGVEYSYNKDQVDELVKFLTDNNITIIPTGVLIELFKMHQKIPLKYSQLYFIFKHKGILTLEQIEEVEKQYESYKEYIDEVLKFLEIIRSYPPNKWLSIKRIEKIIKKNNLNIQRHEIYGLLALMINPLVGLIESKNNENKKFRQVSNIPKEAVERKIEKLKRMLEEYLDESP